MGARYYDGQRGQFTSQDPANLEAPEQFLYDPQQLNTYAYARNNPLRRVDPDGRASEDVQNEKNRIIQEQLSEIRSTVERLYNSVLDLTPIGDASVLGTGQTMTGEQATGLDYGVAVLGISTGGVASKGGKTIWKVGGDIYQKTKKGLPSWSTVRSRFWKNEAADNASDYSVENIDRMQRGLAPQRYNPAKGGVESKELSHEPIPARDGGTNVVPRWPQDHAKVDPYRHPGY